MRQRLCAACAPHGIDAWRRGATDVPPCQECGRWDRPVRRIANNPRMTVRNTAAAQTQDRGPDPLERHAAKGSAPQPEQEK